MEFLKDLWLKISTVFILAYMLIRYGKKETENIIYKESRRIKRELFNKRKTELDLIRGKVARLQRELKKGE